MNGRYPLPPEPGEQHFLIAEVAARTLGQLLDGNGCRAEQVRLKKHDTLVHQIPGFLRFRLEPLVTKTDRPGRLAVGESAASAQDVSAKAAALIADFLKSETILQILHDLQDKEPGLGFGMVLKTLKLAQAPKEYSVTDVCGACSGATSMACRRCAATGFIPCGVCGGDGVTACPACFGSGATRNSDGSSAPCPQCQGRRTMTCMTCAGARQISCMDCNGLRQIPCRDCQQTGYWTHVFSVSYNIHMDFTLEREKIPPEVLEIIDTLDIKKIALEKHAEFFTLPEGHEKDALIVPIVAFLPAAEVEFSIEGKIHPALVAGLQGKILFIEPVLDTLIKPGINALYKIARGPMAVESLMTMACKYRALRDVLVGLSHQPKKQVLQKIVASYPAVLSDKYARACIKYAEGAILCLGRGPRLTGLAIGTIITGLLAALYYLTPARALVLQILTAQAAGKHILLLDILVWAAGWGVCVYLIKTMAADGLKKFIPALRKEKRKGLPAAGDEGLYALATSFAAWLTLAALAPDKPLWLLMLLKKAGL